MKFSLTCMQVLLPVILCIASVACTKSAIADSPDAAFVLAQNGKTEYTIVLPEAASPVDQYAADTLAKYLQQSTGATFELVKASPLDASQRAIFVGLGDAAKQRMQNAGAGKSQPSLQGQQFVCRTHDGDVFLYGHDMHGSLHAVMHFLQSQIGFRWYTVFDPPVVPKHDTLAIKPMNERGGFSFPSREVALRWDVDFFYQNGINQGYARLRKQNLIDPDSPYQSWLPTTNFVHTAFSYIPPNEKTRYAKAFAWQDKFNYFETNPEYFSLNSNGQRVDTMQLCYSNPQLRAELTRNVLHDIKHSQERIIITMDAADNPGRFCHCENCIALEEKYQSPGGPLYDYTIELCEKLKQSHPQTMVRLLAYRHSQTQTPPALPQGQMLPENLIVTFAPIEDAYFADWNHPDESIQQTFADLKAWAAITHHLWAWIYPNPWGSGDLMPLGNVQRLITNIRLMHEAGVTGLFADHAGYLTRSGFSELQLYLMFKLMQDIDCDTDAVIGEFLAYQYSDAAPLVRKYMDELEAGRLAMKTLPPGVRFNSDFYDAMTFPYVTAQNVDRWQGYFREMLTAVAADSREAKNVKLLRRELDFATLHRWKELAQFRPEAYVDYEPVMQRIREANRLTSARAAVRPRMLGENQLENLAFRLSMDGIEKPLPAVFDGIDASRIRTFLPRTQRKLTPQVEDDDAAFGVAATVHHPEQPFRFGYCQWLSRSPSVTDRGPDRRIAQHEITPGQYKLYRLGVIQVDVYDAMIWFGGSWATHVQVGQSLHQPGEKNLWDAYASIKFDGPAYGGSASENAVLVGRIILVKVDEKNQQAVELKN